MRLVPRIGDSSLGAGGVSSLMMMIGMRRARYVTVVQKVTGADRKEKGFLTILADFGMPLNRSPLWVADTKLLNERARRRKVTPAHE